MKNSYTLLTLSFIVSSLLCLNVSASIAGLPSDSTKVSSLAVNAPPHPPPAFFFSQTELSCRGDSNASITAWSSSSQHSSGGGANYYWSTGQVDTVGDSSISTISNLVAGQYSVTVAGPGGPWLTQQFTVVEPDTLTIGFNKTDVQCFGDSNGQVTGVINGGYGNYTYAWQSPGQAATQVIANQSFEGSGTWGYNNNPASYSVGTDIWDTKSSMSSISSAADGTTFWAGRDLDNPNGGNANFHYLTFDTVNVSAYINVKLSFQYYTVGFDGTDEINYEVLFDTANTWTSATNLSKNTGAWTTVTVNIPEGTQYVRLRLGTKQNGGNDYFGFDNIKLEGVTYGTSGLTLQNLSKGWVQLFVQDGGGCNKTDSIEVIEPSAISASPTILHAGCNPNGGSISLAVSGGVAPYTYNWQSGQQDSVISNLTPGWYNVTITDQSACILLDSFEILNLSNTLSTAIDQVTHVQCNGDTTGGVEFNAAGGNGPLSYSLSSGQTGLVSSLPAVVASQSFEGSGSIGYQVTPPFYQQGNDIWSPVSSIGSISSPSNGSSFLGIRDLDNSNGGGSFYHSIIFDPVQVSSFSNASLSFDYNTVGFDATDRMQYQIRFDSNDNWTAPVDLPKSSSGWQTITEAIPGGTQYVRLLVRAAQNGNSDYAGLDNIRVEASSATTVNNLTGGTHYLTVTDTVGCTVQDTITINSLVDFTTGISQDSVLTCLNLTQAKLSAQPMLGGVSTSNVQYSWSTGDTTRAVSGLGVGLYKVTVTSISTGCQAIDSFQVVAPVSPSVSITQLAGSSCAGSTNGALMANASGGTMPYQYLWSNGAVQPNNMGLSAGIYTVTVSDSNGCSATAQFTLTNSSSSNLNLTLAITNQIQCFGDSTGSVQSTVSGGTSPYQYGWNTGVLDSVLTSIPAGSYTLTVTDANGCKDTSDVQLIAPTALSISASVQQALSCPTDSNGVATVTVNAGNGPYQYAWNNGLTTATIVNLKAGIYTVTVSDVNACSKTDTVNIVGQDLIAPVVSTNNLTAYLDGTGQTSITVSQVNNGSSDNCGIASETLSQTNFDCSHLGINNVQFTVTDFSGNQSSSNVIITVTDTTSPVITAVNNVTLYLDGNGQASLNANMVDNGSSDNCGIATRTLSQSSFDCGNIGTNTIQFIVTDSSGNSASLPVQITVADTMSPIVITNNATVYLDGSGQALINVSMVDNGSSDNCGIATRTLSQSSFDCSNIGLNTIQFTVLDSSGNSVTSSVQIMVTDTISPIVSVNNPTVYLDGSGQASINIGMADNGSSDNCGIATSTLSQSSFDCNDIGMNLIQFTVTDSSGNSVTSPVQIMVTDTISPIVSVNNPTVYLDGSGQASINIGMVDNGSSDNCGIATSTLSQSNFNCGDIGMNTIQFTVTDSSGNITSSPVQVMVADTVSPVVSTNNATVYLDGNGQGTISPATINNGSTDNCGIASNMLSQSSFDCNDIGVNTIQFTVTDSSGNSTVSSVQVTVFDTVYPVAQANNLTIYLDANGQAIAMPNMVNNGSSDNCGIITESLSQTIFDCSQVGANSILYTVSDGSANSSSISTIVTVLDTIRPIVQADSVLLYLDNTGQGMLTTSMLNNTPSDNCGITSQVFSQTAFDCSQIGTNTIQLTVTDASSNVASSNIIVTVLDTISPVVSVNNPMAYLDVNGQVTVSISSIDNGSTDNCGLANQTLSQQTFGCNNLGTNSVLYTVTDVIGNQASMTSIVTVVDTISPVALASNVTVYLDVNGQASVTASQVNNASTDNCSIATQVLSQSNFDCSHIGTNNVQFTVTDSSGNTGAIGLVVNVLDTISPTVQLNTPVIYLDANGQGTVTASMLINNVSDNCGIASQTLNQSSFDCTQQGANSIQLAVTDVNGNVTIATSIVTVSDTISPTIQANNVTLYLDGNGQASLSPNMVDNGSSDNCGVTGQVLSQTTFDCSHIGANNVQYTVTDDALNSVSTSLQVTVVDTLSPIALTSNVTVYLDASGQANITANMVDNGSSDNCGIASQSINQTAFDCSHIGVNSLEFSVEDVNGNTTTILVDVTVMDTTAPTITCPSDTAICEGIFDYSIPTGTDICGGVTVSKLSGLNSGEFFKAGQQQLIFEAQDNASNTAQCTTNVTVNPLPVVSLGDDEVLTEDGVTFYFVASVDTSHNFLWSTGSTSFDLTFVSPPSDTTLWVEVVSDFGCVNSDTVAFTFAVGIDQPINSELEIKAYPNPVSDELTVEFKGTVSNEVELQLYSLTGRMMMTRKVTSTDKFTIEVDDYPHGVYILRAIDGQAILTKRLIIE